MVLQLQQQLIQPAMKEANLILDRLIFAGFSAYFVGGAVRDTLLQIPIHDIDIATSALPEQVMELFDHCIPTGLQHGTVTVIEQGVHYEVTTFRTEDNYTDYRRPSEVSFVTSLELDLQRRDFTINAMAIDRHYQLIDPFSGRIHLAKRKLITVGSSRKRFDEDALRMLRAIRFAAIYNLEIDSQCADAISEQGYKLLHVAMERVAYEISRLLGAEQITSAIELLLHSRLLKHCKAALFLADAKLLDKPSFTIDRNQPWLYLMAYVGLTPEQAMHDMNKLRLSKTVISETKNVLELKQWFEQSIDPISKQHIDSLQKLQLEWVQHLILYPKQTVRLFLTAYTHSHPLFYQLVNFNNQLPIHHPNQLVVSGHDLIKWSGNAAGPWVKEKLQELFVKVALGYLDNDKLLIKQEIVNNTP